MPNLSYLTDFELPEPDRGAGITIRPVQEVEQPSKLSSTVDKVLNSLFRDDDKRYQLWPEKVIREGVTAAGKVASGEVPQWAVDKDTGDVHTSPQMIEKAQEISALAGTGGLAGGAEGTALNATPSLRPALKYKDKLHKGKEGQQHLDVIPESIYPTFQKKALSGEDINEFNFGFVNDKGHFLNREDALKYGIDSGLIDPKAGKFGALTSTMTNEPIWNRDPYSYSNAQNKAIQKYMNAGKSLSEAEKLVFGSDAYTTAQRGLTTQLLADSSKPGTAIESQKDLPSGYNLKSVDYEPDFGDK